jgi:hypothetical protein
LDLRASAFLLELGEIGSLAGFSVPPGEAVIGLSLYGRPTPHERPSTVLDVD